jgi:hypothetical protein
MENSLDKNTTILVNNPEIETANDDTDIVNVYPIVRHLFLTLCILLAIAIILFLIYQNGKSIYVKGV